jgi:hypothetical protein
MEGMGTSVRLFRKTILFSTSDERWNFVATMWDSFPSGKGTQWLRKIDEIKINFLAWQTLTLLAKFMILKLILKYYQFVRIRFALLEYVHRDWMYLSYPVHHRAYQRTYLTHFITDKGNVYIIQAWSTSESPLFLCLVTLLSWCWLMKSDSFKWKLQTYEYGVGY